MTKFSVTNIYLLMYGKKWRDGQRAKFRERTLHFAQCVLATLPFENFET